MPYERVQRAFWTNESRYETLRKGFQAICSVSGRGATAFELDVEREVESRRLSDSYLTSSKTMERLGAPQGISGTERPMRSAAQRTALLLACRSFWRVFKAKTRITDTNLQHKITKLIHLADELDELAGFEPATTDVRDPIQLALDLIGRYLGMQESAFSAVAQLLIPKWSAKKPFAPAQQNFLCYRYDVKPGKIAKSFMRIHGPTATARICTFDNFFQDAKGRLREARGIVVPMQKVIYLIGQVESGSGLKIVALKKPSKYGHEIDGLLMSFSSVEDLVCKRCPDPTFRGGPGGGLMPSHERSI